MLVSSRICPGWSPEFICSRTCPTCSVVNRLKMTRWQSTSGLSDHCAPRASNGSAFATCAVMHQDQIAVGEQSLGQGRAEKTGPNDANRLSS